MTAGRRRAPAGVLVTGLVALMVGCGPPGDGEARRVDPDDVPYRLLEPDDGADVTPSPAPSGEPAPHVFWVVDDDRLVPSGDDSSCDDETTEVVDGLLAAVASGPSEDDRDDGRSTALPPESGLRLVEVQDGVAEVEVVTGASVSADRLPIAVGQVVLAVASAPGVDAVLLSSDGEALPAPLPGGALTTAPVTAADYAPLLSADARRLATGCGGV